MGPIKDLPLAILNLTCEIALEVFFYKNNKTVRRKMIFFQYIFGTEKHDSDTHAGIELVHCPGWCTQIDGFWSAFHHSSAFLTIIPQTSSAN